MKTILIDSQPKFMLGTTFPCSCFGCDKIEGLTGIQRKGCNFDFIDILLRDKTMIISLLFRVMQCVWIQKFSSVGSRFNQ